YKAIAFSETGDMALAERAFQSVSLFSASQSMIWRIRHHLRYGALDKASALIEEGLKGEQSAAIWPYASIAWRLTADARADWLDAHGALVSVLDIREDLPPLDQLRNHLRGLHRAKGEYLDQSVRGGTQTDGPLLSRIEPEIRTTREAILKAVRKYVSELSPIDPAHPLLGHRRDRRPRFAGSWSVRLRGEGHHANHVHPQGWISSALYISLPERTGGSGDETAGWLTLGKPQESLGIDLPATRLIEPREGQLVLFPSWMWHGTLPFPEGERLTIAFDVAPPR
ncbi:MAG TPA: putative 2OG-Fe(II) oxygenase, partial [Allosphingosinicella sp.]|uniref:putative 2OG-Fe(II) oxygenase n=1 Tax=Allosphingosinicella sp. TaxID=2823234 RepID=UPI002ED8303B